MEPLPSTGGISSAWFGAALATMGVMLSAGVAGSVYALRRIRSEV